jgi:hypothetical protein
VGALHRLYFDILYNHLYDAVALDFPDASFDKVLCLHMRDFLEAHGAAVQEMVRQVRALFGRLAVDEPRIAQEHAHQDLS